MTTNTKIKKIVAFSLLKQIEIESQEIKCKGEIASDTGSNSRKFEKWTKITGTTIFVYSFYHDDRLEPFNYIRIIAMAKGGFPEPLYCQFPTVNGTFRIIKAKPTAIWSVSWDNSSHYYHPFLISCFIPSGIPQPLHFYLGTNPCKITGIPFEIITKAKPPQMREFTLCVKPLNFSFDNTEYLLQWIVINQILGANSIQFYLANEGTPQTLMTFLRQLPNVTWHRHLDLNDNAKKRVDAIWQKRRYEVITYNDCFYRNIHSSRFVIPIDVDEIIIPRHVRTWAELLREGDDNFASFTVRNAYYLRQFNTKSFNHNDEIVFFRHVIRAQFSNEGESGKSFISTKNALTIFNHYALETLKPEISKVKFLKKELVQMNHYKNECSTILLPQCGKYLDSSVRIHDGVILKYRQEFHEKYGFLKKDLKIV